MVVKKRPWKMHAKLINQLQWMMSMSFFNKYKDRKTNLRGYNSYVADEAYEEFQVDLFFTNDWDEFEKLKFRVGLLMIDVFSKYISVIPINSKELIAIVKFTKWKSHNECIRSHSCIIYYLCDATKDSKLCMNEEKNGTTHPQTIKQH